VSRQSSPPPLATWLIHVSTIDGDRQAVIGDLIEEFHFLEQTRGGSEARRWFWRQTLTSLMPNILRRLRGSPPSLLPGSQASELPGFQAFELSSSRASLKDRLMTSLWQDMRFGWRTIRRRPVVTAVAVLSLVVGISMSAVVFSLLDAAVLSPLAVKDPRALALVLNRRGPDDVNHNFSYPDFADYRGGQRAFVDLVAYSRAELTVRAPGAVAEVINGELVSGTFFSTIGPRLIAGRGIVEDDDRPGAAPVLVMNEALWRRLFGDPRTFQPRPLLVNDREFTVIGVVDASFHGMTIGSNCRLWGAVSQQPVLDPLGGVNLLPRRGTSWLTVMGRLKPDATFDTAAADLNRIEAALAPVVKRQEKRQLFLKPGEQGDSSLPTTSASPLTLLFGAALLVLLVACANVANLLLGRASDRSREIAVRAALGASRARIGRLLLVEALMLGATGSVLGLVAAIWLAGLAVPLFAEFGRPVTLDVGLNWRILVFAIGTGVAATTLAGLAPMFSAMRTMPAGSLGEGGRTASGGIRAARLRQGLVVLQFALSLALVVSAILLVRTLTNLRAIPTGLDLHHVALLSVDPMAAQYKPPRIRQYYADAEARLAAVPGVRATGYGRVIPVGFGGSRTSITVPGYQPANGEDMEINYNTVSPGYFAALDITILAGRAFSDGDIEGRPLVAVVNETMAKQYWPNRQAVGQIFHEGELTDPPIEVVGVARDVKYRSLREEARPSFYRPVAQRRPASGVLHVRTAGDPSALIDTLRKTLAGVDPAVPIADALTLEQQVDLNVNDERVAMTIGLALAVAALVLAAVGLYGAMSYAVGQRRREIGVRIALGAVPRDVRRLVLGDGLRLAVLGSAAGLAIGIGLGRVIQDRLYGVTPGDATSLAIAVIVLSAVALIASWVPARRAARVDPVDALRTD
jgi:putative ABC transport system permease protein